MTGLADGELRRRLAAAEDELTEFKQSASDTRAIRNTIVAFANTVADGETGTLFLGVRANGAIVGLDDLDAQQKRLRKIGADGCFPPITVTCRTIEVQDKHVLVVMVPHSSNRPHFAGHAYVRRGSETVGASKEQHESLVASRLDVGRKIQSLGQQVVSLESVGKILGNPRPVEPAYSEGHEVYVHYCDGHSLTVVDIGSRQYFNEPLENVVVLQDQARHRPKLLIRFPRR